MPAVLIESVGVGESNVESGDAASGAQEERWCRLVVFQAGHTLLALLLDEAPALWSQPVWYQQQP